MSFTFKDHWLVPKRELNNGLGGILVDLLVYLEAADIPCVAAGGALRDSILCVPVKDIDLFVPGTNIHPHQIIHVFRSWGFHAQEIVSVKAAEYLSFTDVRSVIECKKEGFPYPVQVILLAKNCETPERIVERLDLGPCQVGMDVRGRVWRSDQFREDVGHRQFTVCRAQGFNDLIRSTKRYNRLAKKFPGWPLIGGL